MTPPNEWTATPAAAFFGTLAVLSVAWAAAVLVAAMRGVGNQHEDEL